MLEQGICGTVSGICIDSIGWPRLAQVVKTGWCTGSVPRYTCQTNAKKSFILLKWRQRVVKMDVLHCPFVVAQIAHREGHFLELVCGKCRC